MSTSPEVNQDEIARDAYADALSSADIATVRAEALRLRAERDAYYTELAKCAEGDDHASAAASCIALNATLTAERERTRLLEGERDANLRGEHIEGHSDICLHCHRERIKFLREEVAHQSREIKGRIDVWVMQEAKIAASESQVRLLREALTKYGKHTAECFVTLFPNGMPVGSGDGRYGPLGIEPVDCDCGLTAALTDKEKDNG